MNRQQTRQTRQSCCVVLHSGVPLPTLLHVEPLRRLAPPVRLEREDDMFGIKPFPLFRHNAGSRQRVPLRREGDNLDIWRALDRLKNALVCALVNGAVVDNARRRLTCPLLQCIGVSHYSRLENRTERKLLFSPVFHPHHHSTPSTPVSDTRHPIRPV